VAEEDSCQGGEAAGELGLEVSGGGGDVVFGDEVPELGCMV
jgi:hypothetical protein